MAALLRVLSSRALRGSSLVPPGYAVSLGWALILAGALQQACALPPAVTPEDPPLVEADEKPPLAPGGLSAEQNQRLLSGGRVEELMEIERQGQRYVGGVSYTLVRAEPRQVFDVLNQLTTLSQVLPSTRRTVVMFVLYFMFVL
jgi:hypothetical protein